MAKLTKRTRGGEILYKITRSLDRQERADKARFQSLITETDQPRRGVTIRYSAKGMEIDATGASILRETITWQTVERFRERYCKVASPGGKVHL